MWVGYVILSAIVLGFYDVFKKLSVKDNAVLPVLFVSTLVSLVFFLPWIIISRQGTIISTDNILYIPYSGLWNNFLIFIKTCLVLCSWVFSFFALKNLPISIVAPIRSTSPVWTLIGAIFLLNETFSVQQWIGIVVVFASIYSYSLIGKREGIFFWKNKWVFFIFLATLFGSASGLYDKFLIAEAGIHRMEVQAWFSVYQSVILLPVVAILWWPKRKANPFEWRWTIPCIGLFLIVSDFFFFYALSIPGALISVVSLVRRGGMVISFLSGLFVFKEENILVKSFALAGVIGGITILYFA